MEFAVVMATLKMAHTQLRYQQKMNGQVLNVSAPQGKLSFQNVERNLWGIYPPSCTSDGHGFQCHAIQNRSK